VQWRISSVEDIGADPAAALRCGLSALADDGRPPSLMFLFSDFRVDASAFEDVLQHEVACPVVGGLAADDNRMFDSIVFAGRRLLHNALVLGAAYGPVRFDIRVAQAMRAVGQPGRVEDAAGNQIRRIDGMGAMAFITRQTGKPVLQTDRGITSLMLIDEENPEEQRVRSIVPDFSASAGTLGLFCGISAGRLVQVHIADPTDLVAGVNEAATALGRSVSKPAGALVVSCVGRKALLGEGIGQEVAALRRAFPAGLPLAGFCSFGEFGPLKKTEGFSRNLFHNMTCVVLILGSG
jgi:hypothetical protein